MDRQTDIARKLIGELEARNADLAAENERLRKAGDALKELVWDDNASLDSIMKACEDWNAANAENKPR